MNVSSSYVAGFNFVSFGGIIISFIEIRRKFLNALFRECLFVCVKARTGS